MASAKDRFLLIEKSEVPLFTALIILHPVTPDDYFMRHIPHRINLLLTFRERYRPGGAFYIDPELARDFFRCSKDISLLMVRFLLYEVGVRLAQGKGKIDAVPKWKPRFNGIGKLTVQELQRDSRHDSILEVLKAANRAVAHVEPIDVEHPLRTNQDSIRLFDAIDFTEEQIKTKIYQDAGRDYAAAMSSPDNQMRRTRLR